MATANQADFPANMTGAPKFHNADAPTGTAIDGMISGSDTQIPAELAGVDPEQLKAIMSGWNVRSTPSFPAPTPQIASPVAPPAAFPAPTFPAADDVDPITAALRAEGIDDPAFAPAPAAPVGELPPPPPDATPAPVPPLAQGARILVNGELVEVPVEQIQSWQALANWSASLPDHVRQAYVGIADGDLVAVSRDQLAQLEARLANPPQPQRVAPAPDPWEPGEPAGGTGQLTQDALAQIQQRLDAMQAQLASAPVDAHRAARAELDQREQMAQWERTAEDVAGRFQRDHQLSDEQLDGLTQYIMATGTVGRISAQSAIHAPDGRLLSAGDPAVIFQRGYEQAHEVLNRFAGAQAATLAEQQVTATAAQMSAVDAKKAAQGASSSTPVAAMTLPDRVVGPMAPHEMEQAIGSYLEGLFSTSPDGVLS